MVHNFVDHKFVYQGLFVYIAIFARGCVKSMSLADKKSPCSFDFCHPASYTYIEDRPAIG